MVPAESWRCSKVSTSWWQKSEWSVQQIHLHWQRCGRVPEHCPTGSWGRSSVLLRLHHLWKPSQCYSSTILSYKNLLRISVMLNELNHSVQKLQSSLGTSDLEFLMIFHITWKEFQLIWPFELQYRVHWGVWAEQEKWTVETRFLYDDVTQCHGSIGGGTELRLGES